ncbi:MAG: TIGR04552 family protein [Bdellovibrionaceae bacterium]|nr:TIGR04552 family protein [Pseudobdellovibrionaceae bacterium]
MPARYNFEFDILNSVAGGLSAIDIPKLNIKTLQEASSFVQSYGFNLEDPEDLERLWYYHRRALVLMVERLGFSESEIPEILRDRKTLADLRHLLLWASHSKDAGVEGSRELQRWSCAILRGMHVFVHSENDLFSSFSEEIQSQILTPFQRAIAHEGERIWLKSPRGLTHIQLDAFEVKPFKTSSSTVIKLLAKPDALAMKIFDKLGVRFVTESLFDSFQVIRFLVEENLMSFAHIMPDQSSNNMYPVGLFIQVCEKLRKRNPAPSPGEVNQIFEDSLREEGAKALLLRKLNEQSGGDFKFIKFITRKLIRVRSKGDSSGVSQSFSFFYPFEVQIMDSDAYKRIASGPSEHKAYKERQKLLARKRLFPETVS